MIFLAMNIQLSYNPVFLLTVLKCYKTDYFEYFIFSHNFNYQFILVQHFHSPGSVDLRWPIAILVVCCCVSLIVSVHAITNTYLLLGIRESVVWVGLHLIRIMKLKYINFNLFQISSPKHLHVHDYSFAGQECLYQNVILHNLLFSCDC